MTDDGVAKMNMLRLCPSCCARECPPDRTVCEKCYPRVAECKQLQQELESTAGKLSDAWLILDEIALSTRDSDQTRQSAAVLLITQQAPGWEGRIKRCANALWNADLPSPRTCEMCGIGVCKLGIKRKGWHK